MGTFTHSSVESDDSDISIYAEVTTSSIASPFSPHTHKNLLFINRYYNSYFMAIFLILISWFLCFAVAYNFASSTLNSTL